MSGGHFNYQQYRIHDFVIEIERLIAVNDSTEKDDYGQDIGYHFEQRTIDKFKEAIAILNKAEAVAERIDYLVSGDDGEDSFHRRWAEDLAKLNT